MQSALHRCLRWDGRARSNGMCGGFADNDGPGIGEAAALGPCAAPSPPPSSGFLAAHPSPPPRRDLGALPKPPSHLLGGRIPASGCGRAGGCRGAWGGGEGRAGRGGGLRGRPQEGENPPRASAPRARRPSSYVGPLARCDCLYSFRRSESGGAQRFRAGPVAGLHPGPT